MVAWYKYIFFRKFPLQVFKVKRNTKNWWQNAITVKIDIISISVKQKGEFSCLDIGLFLGNLKIIGKLEEFHLKHINHFFQTINWVSAFWRVHFLQPSNCLG